MYKVLTFRTLIDVLRGEATYWRLSDPLLFIQRVRGSILLELSTAYLLANAGTIAHWCPLDSGGVRHRFQPIPSSLQLEDLLFDSRSAERLLAACKESAEETDRVRTGRPVRGVTLRALMPRRPAQALDGFDDVEWTYEVHLAGGAARPAGSDVVQVLVPNTAARIVVELLELEDPSVLRTYNPRWPLEHAV